MIYITFLCSIRLEKAFFLEFLRDVERHFIGHDPFDIEDLYRRLTLLDFGKPGEVVYTGLALVELAFWDIMGKFTNLPVYKLLGVKVKDKIQECFQINDKKVDKLSIIYKTIH